jgi:hypothetical protein
MAANLMNNYDINLDRCSFLPDHQCLIAILDDSKDLSIPLKLH